MTNAYYIFNEFKLNLHFPFVNIIYTEFFFKITIALFFNLCSVIDLDNYEVRKKKNYIIYVKKKNINLYTGVGSGHRSRAARGDLR